MRGVVGGSALHRRGDFCLFWADFWLEFSHQSLRILSFTATRFSGSSLTIRGILNIQGHFLSPEHFTVIDHGSSYSSVHFVVARSIRGPLGAAPATHVRSRRSAESSGLAERSHEEMDSRLPTILSRF